MSKSLLRTGLIAVAVSVGSLGAFSGIAEADGIRVVLPAPFFVPGPQFNYQGGYYRTREGHYYHRDSDRDGWHYGRNHRDGERWESRHQPPQHRR